MPVGFTGIITPASLKTRPAGNIFLQRPELTFAVRSFRPSTRAEGTGRTDSTAASRANWRRPRRRGPLGAGRPRALLVERHRPCRGPRRRLHGVLREAGRGTVRGGAWPTAKEAHQGLRSTAAETPAGPAPTGVMPASGSATVMPTISSRERCRPSPEAQRRLDEDVIAAVD